MFAHRSHVNCWQFPRRLLIFRMTLRIDIVAHGLHITSRANIPILSSLPPFSSVSPPSPQLSQKYSEFRFAIMARNVHLIVRSARNTEWSGGGCYPAHTPPKLYITLKVNERRDKTETKDEADPQWNTEFTFPALEDEHVIRFRLKAVAMLCRDRIIGEIECTVADLLTPDSPKELQIFGVDDEAKSSTGTIVVDVEAISVDDAAKRLVEDAQAMDNIAHKVNELKERLQTLKLVVSVIDQVAKLNSKVELAWHICSALYKVVNDQCSTDQKVISLINTMICTLDFAQDSRKLNEYVISLETTITNLVTQVAECAIFVREYFRPSFLARLAGQLLIDSNKKSDDLVMKLTSLRADLESKIPLHVGTKMLEGQVEAKLVSAKIFMDVSQLRESDALRELKPTHMNVGTRPLCLRGTREIALEKIMNWILDIDNIEQNVLWIYGLAGSGKSTIARTIAARLDGLGRRGGFLFFERGKINPDAVVQTLAVQLANSDPLLRFAICEAIEENRNITTASLEDQFDSLLRGPLTKAARSLHGPIVVVLDALDEYGDTASRKSLLKLLSNELPKFPSNFRFLLTSRPESSIFELFSKNLKIRSMSLKDMEDAAPAIRVYLSAELMGILGSDAILNASTRPDFDSRWKETNLDQLVKMSEGLFIWASTLIGFLMGVTNPANQLERILSSKTTKYIQGLDDLYATVLDACNDWGEGLDEEFRSIAGTILFCHQPLSDAAIDELLNLPDHKSCKTLFKRLRCLFDYEPGKPIRPLHASFRDYLVDEKRSIGKSWSLAGFDIHHYLLECCFRVMSKQLRFNICDFEASTQKYSDLEERIEKNISSSLKYASGHWVEHLDKVKTFPADTQRALELFSNQQIFFWLEVVSLCYSWKYQILDRCCYTVRRFLQDKKDAKRLSNLWYSVLTFWYQYCKVFNVYTPHLYVSGFTYPGDSDLISTYASLFTTAKVIAHQDVMQISEEDAFGYAAQYGHSEKNTCISFSPDGTKFLVSSLDGAVHVRNSFDYTMVKEYWPLNYTSSVDYAIFSTNSKYIYSALGDGTIHSSSGAILYQPKVDMGRVHSMTVLASSSDEHIAVLYAKGALVVSSDGVLIQKPYMFDSGPFYCGSISRQGLLALSFGKRSSEIFFFNLRTEISVISWQTSYKRVENFIFSPDGDKIALFIYQPHYDDRIDLWNVDTKECLQQLSFCGTNATVKRIQLYGSGA
ncbi:hypothetical protein QCA50_016913 [Cerrena zonata]|uniref:C2 domain-containing protein n=1 Tax=Cerrena zonata TaxID=2478898 RepID=A0AAW0FKW6_9APHY